ncbi:MAG TPA: hypothetical protein VI522_01335, partial [Gammaproteobacteria bacterium]|nr:hypothetical protein [Gammaproteobacteria bacterium]
IQYLGEHLSDALDPQSLGNLLRNVLKIFLLHNRYNPFSQATRTGTLALTLLNQAPYQKIARKIKQEPLVYEDLMNYVTGTNDHQHFDSTHAEEVYTHLNDEISKNSYRCFLNKHPNAYWK